MKDEFKSSPIDFIADWPYSELKPQPIIHNKPNTLCEDTVYITTITFIISIN